MKAKLVGGPCCGLVEEFQGVERALIVAKTDHARLMAPVDPSDPIPVVYHRYEPWVLGSERTLYLYVGTERY